MLGKECFASKFILSLTFNSPTSSERIMEFRVTFARFTVLLLGSCLSVQFGQIQGQKRVVRSSSSEDAGAFYYYYEYPKYPRDCKAVLYQCSTSSEETSDVFLIKPDGYYQPFEVYCDNYLDSGGWTVIMRRSDGSLDFDRSWEEYEVGFGFLSGEFWLGFEKLSYLSNQAVYELYMDVSLSNGLQFYVKYNSFRISDDFGQYKLVSVGTYIGNASLAISDCPANMVYGNCTCQPTCSDPSGSTTCHENKCMVEETCVCVDGFLRNNDTCVLPSGCGCYIAETGSIILENEMYVNVDCSEKCVCQGDQLICNSTYECSTNAECRSKEGVRQCYCNEGYEGDGETCRSLPRDCYDIYQAGLTQNDVYTILPAGWHGSPFSVYCDMTTSGGGWTVFQRRIDGATNFYRSWTSYKNGFGVLESSNDFWLGNEQLYYLTNTNQKNYKLRVDIVTAGGSSKYDEYASFRIDNESTKYQLVDIGSFSGTAGNGMQYASGNLFSTFDSDNDQCGNHNCAMGHRGAWWYKPSALVYNYCTRCNRNDHCDQFPYGSDGCNTICSKSNLNSDYAGTKGANIYWSFSGNCNLRSAEMKIRPT